MADERYQWLDQEAAERLLRGLPVDPLDGEARDQAERLAHALDAARQPAVDPAAREELPGEAAALAAFRRATAARAAASLPAAADLAGPLPASGAAELHGVRIGRLPAARRWGRSVRYGLAAAVAAVAVGGVAVASGTGLIPTPFDEAPAPADSVTVADSPEPLVSGGPDDGFGTVTPSAPPSTDDLRPGPSSSPAAPGVTETPGVSGTPSRDTPEPGASSKGTEWDAGVLRTRILKACQDLKDGRISDSDRRRLTDSAETGETVRRYCDRILAGGSPGTAEGSSGRASGGTGGDGSTGSGDRGDSRESGGTTGRVGGVSRTTAGAPDGGSLSAETLRTAPAPVLTLASAPV
ncbi:hypothetical protein ABZZ37_16960 [Streptomyces sp. NPDC006464]|uniref:hypothetical protein n=1 Tax=Streptomyces sp. NPDC006464 TaxID=3154305 RepID=UPI0033A6DB75